MLSLWYLILLYELMITADIGIILIITIAYSTNSSRDPEVVEVNVNSVIIIIDALK